MPLYALNDTLWFPPVEEALPDGLLAIGGDLSVERLLTAYKKGIFPWYDSDLPLWWCPDPRFVLYPAELRISKSMKTLFNRQAFAVTYNQAFEQVIANCKEKDRPGQDGTWISQEVMNAYIELHKLGVAHSVETWLNGQLVGGLYGIKIGKVFFGESMFSHASNASKYAFISYVGQLAAEGFELIDCQVYTEHLESLGARMIPRKNFLEQVTRLIEQ